MSEELKGIEVVDIPEEELAESVEIAKESEKEDEFENTFTYRLYESATNVANVIVTDSASKGKSFISKEILPVYKLISFKRFLIENEYLTGDLEWLNKSLFESFEDICQSEEINLLQNHHLYKIYSEIVDSMIEDAKTLNDESQILYKSIKDLTQSILSTVNNVNEILESTNKETLAFYLESIMKTFSEKAELLNTLIALS